MANKLGFSTGKGFHKKVDYAAQADNATNAVNAAKTDFTHANWSSTVRTLEIADKGLYEIFVDGRMLLISLCGANTSTSIVETTYGTRASAAGYCITGFTEYKAKMTEDTAAGASILTAHKIVYALDTTFNDFVLQSDTVVDFRYRKIR